MSVLVDSSIWIDYFRGDGDPAKLERLIDENLLVVNDLILAELIPALELMRQRKLIALLRTVRRDPVEIDWEDVMRMQVACLKNGLNKIGIPDLVIAQQSIRSGSPLYTEDKHFALMGGFLPLKLF